MAKTKLTRLSLDELQAEIRRRERELTRLQKERDKLSSKLADVDRRIAQIDGSRVAAGPRRAATTTTTTRRRAAAPAGKRRPKNKMPLIDVLLHVFPRDKPMKVSDAVAAARKSGYKTSARNFSTIVNQALIKDPRFQQVKRGYYQVVGE